MSTTDIREIWSDGQRYERWHELWLSHLAAQIAFNPNHPADAAAGQRYQDAAARYPQQRDVWDRRRRELQQTCQHEVVAALQVFNEQAEADLLHLGLASSDIVDPTTQGQILDSVVLITERAASIADRLRLLMLAHRDHLLLARTHGQPAQVTTWGHRHATVLGPLLDWVNRASYLSMSYPLRPAAGAVGTAADLQRVLDGWGFEKVLYAGPEGQPDVPDGGEGTKAPPKTRVPTGPRVLRASSYMSTVAATQGPSRVMTVTRQVYHRSYDLSLAGLMVELAAIAQTWVTDRRLESVMGLGNEGHLPVKVASSSMSHKLNPRFGERCHSLAIVTRGYHSMLTELAGTEWLEGDVSGSAARRIALPGLFTTVDDLLNNWWHVIKIWEPALQQMADEVTLHQEEVSSGALLYALVEDGMTRTAAHQLMRQAWKEGGAQTLSGLMGQTRLEEVLGGPPALGTVQAQIDALDRRVSQMVQTIGPHAWDPAVSP